MAEQLLTIRDLNVSYGNHQVVRHVDVSVEAGKVHALIGESGSGKSTIAAAAMGLLPDHAQVWAKGSDLLGHGIIDVPEKEWRLLRGKTVAMVFQEPLSALNPTMTIGAHIALALNNHHVVPKREVRAEVLRLLNQVHLPDPDRRMKQYPHQLSGGQLQRVVIAMAMAARPRVLIADEPTTALDVTVQAQILRLFRELADNTGVGILFISHDLGVVAQLADRITVLYRGVAVQEGATQAVLHGVQHPYTKALLLANPRSAPPLQPLPTIDLEHGGYSGVRISTTAFVTEKEA